MKELFRYLGRPYYRDLNIPVTSFLFIKYLLVCIVFEFFLSFPASLLNAFHLLPENTVRNMELTWKNVLSIILIAPILEELAFRMYLRPRKYVFSISLSFLVTGTLNGFMELDNMEKLILFGLSMLVFLVIERSFILEKFMLFWKKQFPVIFYTSAVIFGFIHYGNFENTQHFHLFLLPLLTLPQVFLGVMLGFIRMQHGLHYAMLFHVALNLLAWVLEMVSMAIFP